MNLYKVNMKHVIISLKMDLFKTIRVLITEI